MILYFHNTSEFPPLCSLHFGLFVKRAVFCNLLVIFSQGNKTALRIISLLKLNSLIINLSLHIVDLSSLILQHLISSYFKAYFSIMNPKIKPQVHDQYHSITSISYRLMINHSMFSQATHDFHTF